MKRSAHPTTDDRGAVMLIAVFFAVFAVSMLYLAIGAGEAVLFREHLQDAADSAALSGAITHARIMNVLVLINMVMVTLLAILVTLKLIEGVAIVGMAIAAGLAWCTFGASLAAIPPLSALKSTVSGIYESVKPAVFDALTTLHDVGDQIAEAAPTLAEDVAQGDLVGREDGIVASGFAASTADKLPVTDDSYEGLCGKAGGLSWQIANIPLSVIPGWSVLADALSGPIQSLTSSLSQWFCGDGQNRVPDLSQTVPMGYPQTKKALDCQASAPDNEYEKGHEEQATSKACQDADAERIAGAPDASGNCQQQCDPGDPYDRAVSNARANCDPSISPPANQYRYQTQEGTVEYKWNGIQWVRGHPTFNSSYANVDPKVQGTNLPCNSPEQPSLFGEKATPCGNLTFAGYYPGYNKLVHPADDPTRVLPVCTNECAPQDPPPKDEQEPVRKVAFRQVTQVISCIRTQREPVDVKLEPESPNSEAKKDGNSKSPKALAEGVTLGSEQLQIRAVAIGNQQQRESAKLVRLSLWGRSDPSNPIERLRDLGGFTYAQAEYYYEGTEGPDAWMWNMNWRGRLKRFELPSSDDASRALADACNRQIPGTSDCSRVLNLVEQWKDFLLH